jgi:GNAT superfamily N-acetyltransferase
MSEDTNLQILPATPEDVPTLLEFIARLAEYERLSHEMEATEPLLHEYLFGRRPVAEALIARLGDKPVGYALYFDTFSTFVGKPGIWLEDLFVLAEHRRRGIGKKLLKAVAHIALSRGCGRLEWSVLDWNAPAIDLYRKMGAQAMTDWTTQLVTGNALTRLATLP